MQDYSDDVEVAGAPAWGAWGSKFTVVVFGVVLPVVCVAVELSSRMCAENFFDPLPTVFHVVAYLAIPAANLWAMFVYGDGQYRDKSEVVWPLVGLGFGFGVAMIYSVLFLPLLPFSPFAMALFGLGFCVLSPYLAMWTCWICIRRLRMLNGDRNANPFKWCIGVVAALVVVCLIELPQVVTYSAMKMAQSADVTTQSSGVAFLRRFGSRRIMLARCYPSNGRRANTSGFAFGGSAITTADAREVFYRVTGESFNRHERPNPDKFGRRGGVFQDDWDAEQGGGVVGARIQKLRLQESRIDGSFDGEAAVGYLEWTMVFHNGSPFRQHEARAQIQLPPGAVVSRLTLWVNGEPREAAFAGKGAVREAYQAVAIRQRRDPVLVTTTGPDCVLVQCFPVPMGGEMKIRLGITVPLALASPDLATCELPRIIEHNFTMDEASRHTIWIEADGTLGSTASLLTASTVKDGVTALRGDLPQAALAAPGVVATLSRRPSVHTSWCEDARGDKPGVVIQELTTLRNPQVQSLVVVVDGSVHLRNVADAISDAFKSSPIARDAKIFLAGDLVETIDSIDTVEFVGGRDNVPALVAAWDAASAGGNAPILWIHGEQPVLLSAIEPLLQLAERRPDVRLVDCAVGPGPNRVVDALGKAAALVSVRRFGDLRSDLERFLAELEAGEQILQPVRRRVAVAPADSPEVEQTSDHLVRLWAYDQTLAQIDDRKRDAAIATAMTYQLVTPVTGAVVLETAAQYEQHGLTPVPPNSVASIPEPQTIALLICMALLLGVSQFLRRRKQAQVVVVQSS